MPIIASPRSRSTWCATWALISPPSRPTFLYQFVILPGVYDFPPASSASPAPSPTRCRSLSRYRAARRPTVERLVDVAAHELGVAPDVLRRRIHRPKACPTPRRPARCTIQEFAAHLARAGDHRLEGLSPPRRAIERPTSCAASAHDHIEACGNNGPDAATVRISWDSNVGAGGSQSTGRGHRPPTQVVAEHLDLPPDRVAVQGDTDLIATGAGTTARARSPAAALRWRARRTSSPTISRRSRPTLSKRRVRLGIENGQVGSRHRSRRLFRRDRRFAGGHARPPVRQRFRRAAAADLSERHPHRRGRNRSRDRAYPHHRLRRGRRFRRDDQPAVAGRPGP